MRTILVLLVAFGAVPVLAANVFPNNKIFSKPVWLCHTPEEYLATRDLPIASRDPGDLACVFIDFEMIEDILAPWVEILEEKDGLAKVTFLHENYKRIRTERARGGQTLRVLYTGWTDPSTLEPMTTF